MKPIRPESDGTPPAGVGEDYFHQFLNRTILLLGRPAVDRLRAKTIAVAGCGGQGGAACLTLARMGVSGFILADPHGFDEPDINRQWAANLNTLGRNKSEVHAEMLRAINPEVRVRTFTNGITDRNVDAFLDGADLLIDCLDICVSNSLRTKLFAAARNKGIYGVTGGMVGFGGFVTSASPDGIPMEFACGFEDKTIQASDLPKLFREVFVPEHIDALAENLGQLHAPSSAVSPAVLGTVLSVEAVLILLGATIPGWRPPVCLPHILLVDLLKMNYRVVDMDELIDKPDASPAKAKAREAGAPAFVEAGRAARLSPADRRSLLAKVGHNTNLLPDDAVAIDLMTDSWSEIHCDEDQKNRPEDCADAISDGGFASPADTLRGLFGYRYFVTVFRGRFAEALLAKALAARGGVGGHVLTNALFPSTRFHLEANGFTVKELLSSKACDPQSDLPFKGDLDLKALQKTLSGPEAMNVKAVYMELCVNALGGQPVSVANLRAVREMTAERGIGLILDATRAFENAVLIRQREAGYDKTPLATIVRELCSLSDACACSCSKDFKCPAGGFVGVQNADTFTLVRDLTLAFGDGLRDSERRMLQRELSRFELWNRASADRVEQVRNLWNALHRQSIPVVAPAGGHGLFVDARALLPHIPPRRSPVQALANELYVAAGVRSGANMATPAQEKRGIQWLRLAIPIARYSDDDLKPVVSGLKAVAANKDNIAGLERTNILSGVIGQYTASFRPVEK